MGREGWAALRILGTLLCAWCWPTCILASEPTSSLDRPHDPVVISGERLPGFIGDRLDEMRLMAFRGETLRVIPFQVDERDSQGNPVYARVYSDGKWRVPEPIEGQGRLSRQDELVFMAFDCGGRLSREAWPPARHAAELRVMDPVRHGEGFAYLFTLENPPPLARERYIRQDVQGRMIRTGSYAYGYHDDPGGGVFDFLAFGDALHTPVEALTRNDVVDKAIFDLRVTFLFRGLSFSWDETDLNAGLTAYKQGPVRVLQKVWYSIDLVLGLKSPRVERVLFSYPGRTVIPTELNMPFNPALFLSSASMRMTLDFSKRIMGSRVYHPQFEEPFILDGKMSAVESKVQETELKLDPAEPIWVAVGGEWGGIMGRVFPAPEAWEALLNMKGAGRTRLYYRDDASTLNPRENEPGSYGQIGGVFDGMRNVSSGKYSMLMIFFAKDHMDEEMIRRLLEVDDRPLVTEVLNPRARPSETAGER